MGKRKTVSLRESTWLKITESRGKDSIDKFLNKVINKFRRENEENIRLKLKVQELKAHGCASQPSEKDFPTKKEWLKSIQENNPPYEPINPDNPLAVECYYHAYDPKTKKHYCEEKPINGYACLRRYQRYQAMKRKCVPIGRKNNSKRKFNRKNNYTPKTGNIFRGGSIDGQW